MALSLDVHSWLGSPHRQYPTDFLILLFFVELIVITN